MGDVLVHDSDEEDSLKYLKMIFEKIREERLKIGVIKVCLLQAPFAMPRTHLPFKGKDSFFSKSCPPLM